MKLRLSDPALMTDLVAHLRGSGFLVVPRDRHELATHLLNHVNDRYDRARASEALRDWRDRHPSVEVEEIG